MRGLKVGRRGVPEGRRGPCVLRRQSIMERGRCEFWPLSRPTYKMYSVVAGSLLKCHTSSFCLSKPRIRLQTRPTACAVGSGCDSRVPWTPSEEGSGKGAPLWLNFNPNIPGSPIRFVHCQQFKSKLEVVQVSFTLKSKPHTKNTWRRSRARRLASIEIQHSMVSR